MKTLPSSLISFLLLTSDSKHLLQLQPKAYFLAIPDQLRALHPNAKPAWGLMSPQHIVEHFVGTWRISNGRAKVPVMMKGEELEKRRVFLFSDEPYAKNITNPIFGDGLAPLRKPNYAAAIDQLEDEMLAFFEYHEANPEAIESHPVFGDLDFDGWLIFQQKHMGHHLSQFGL